MNDPKQILDPAYVIHLVEKLTEAEADELEVYASGGVVTPESYVVRASYWLRRHFRLDRHTDG